MDNVAPRYDVSVQLEVSVGSRTAAGRSSDLSTSGIGAYIPFDLDIGQYVNLQLRLPFKREQVMCGAVVRNRLGYRYGLEFAHMRLAEQDVINDICARLGNLSSLEDLQFDS